MWTVATGGVQYRRQLRQLWAYEGIHVAAAAAAAAAKQPSLISVDNVRE